MIAVVEKVVEVVEVVVVMAAEGANVVVRTRYTSYIREIDCYCSSARTSAHTSSCEHSA